MVGKELDYGTTRLITNDYILERLEFIQGKVAERAEITIADVIKELGANERK